MTLKEIESKLKCMEELRRASINPISIWGSYKKQDFYVHISFGGNGVTWTVGARHKLDLPQTAHNSIPEVIAAIKEMAE